MSNPRRERDPSNRRNGPADGLVGRHASYYEKAGLIPQLDVHLNAALNVGLTPTEIVEALIRSAVYCGFPKALNAVFVAKRVFADRGLLPVGGHGHVER